METLGLSPSTPKPENRLKNLFWPTIRNEVDVDHIGRQGFWICLVVSLFTMAINVVLGARLVGLFELAFFLLGGIGVRQRSRIAAIAVFSAYLLMTLEGMRITHQGPGVIGIIFLALLLANVRGTWLSAQRRNEATDPPPIPLSETLSDKLTDQLPIYVWPLGQWVFCVLAVLQLGALLLALFAIRIRG